jgi:hypothetical protein
MNVKWDQVQSDTEFCEYFEWNDLCFFKEILVTQQHDNLCLRLDLFLLSLHCTELRDLNYCTVN